MAKSELERSFDQAMFDIYRQAKEQCGYVATRFLGMLIEKSGGLEPAKQLINDAKPSDGFTALWECGRLDLTVEAHALKPQFKSLFSAEELAKARRRLEDVGYDFDATR